MNEDNVLERLQKVEDILKRLLEHNFDVDGTYQDGRGCLQYVWAQSYGLRGVKGTELFEFLSEDQKTEMESEGVLIQNLTREI